MRDFFDYYSVFRVIFVLNRKSENLVQRRLFRFPVSFTGKIRILALLVIRFSLTH